MKSAKVQPYMELHVLLSPLYYPLCVQVLQKSYPQQPMEWYHQKQEEGEKSEAAGYLMGQPLVRGGRRWIALPNPAQVSL